VAPVGVVPNVLVVHPSFPAKNMEFLDVARAQRPPYQYASAGNGSLNHLLRAHAESGRKARSRHVPYKGVPPAGWPVPDDLRQLASCIRHIKAGKLRALGVSSRKRSPFAADIPVIAESLPGFARELWIGLIVGAGPPDAVVRKLAQEVEAAVGITDVQEQFATLGLEKLGRRPGLPGQHAEDRPGVVKAHRRRLRRNRRLNTSWAKLRPSALPMELRQLRYFVGVSDAGSLLKASRTLHVAQPALSQHMATLEAELRTTLFERSSRGMALTESGRRFLEHARVVLADVERARISVQAGEEDFAGEVSIGLPTTVALVATLPILQAIRERFPKVLPRLIESHSGYLREWLHGGRLDLSVLFAVEQAAWLLQKPILSEKLCLIGPRGKKVQLPATLALRQLASYPVLLPGRDHGLRRILDEACAQNDVVLDVVGEIDSLPNIKKAVEAGMAYTVLSPGAVTDEVASGRLQSATLRSPAISRTIVCATSLTRPLTPAAAAVGALVCERLQALVREGHWPATLERG